MANPLLNIVMHDGSRHFGQLPESASWYKLRRHVQKLPGVTVTSFLTDHITEAWIDFSFRDYEFSINNQFGSYWFFAKPQSPDEILETLLSHCRKLLGG